MSTISINQLKKITDNISTTRCGETAEFVAGALSNQWTDEILENPVINDYYNDHWFSISYSSINQGFKIDYVQNSSVDEFIKPSSDHFVKYEDIIDMIEKGLNEAGYIKLDIDMDSTCNKINLEHVAVICNSDIGEVIVDSYINFRGPGIKSFNYRQILPDFVKNPSIESWNQICQSNHKFVQDDTSHQFDIFLGISYIKK